MSRSGYTDDNDDGILYLYRANVDRCLAGKQGQKFLREVLATLDEMPVKELVGDSFVTKENQFCTLGAVGARRRLDIASIDPDDVDPGDVASMFGVPRMLVAEIMYENDECGRAKFVVDDEGHARYEDETDAERWARMRKWAASHIVGTK